MKKTAKQKAAEQTEANKNEERTLFSFRLKTESMKKFRKFCHLEKLNVTEMIQKLIDEVNEEN